MSNAKIFYDQYFEAELARPNLDTYLQGIFHDIRNLIRSRQDDEI